MSREELCTSFKATIEILQSVKDRCKVLSEIWGQFSSFLTQLESLQDHQQMEPQDSSDTVSKQSVATVNETTSDRKMRFQEVCHTLYSACADCRCSTILTSKLHCRQL